MNNSGFLLIDKQPDWTSNDVTVYIRNKARKVIKSENPHIKYVRVGHAGTLDPFATGLLIVGVGRHATRKLDEFKNLPKTYETVLQLGATSTTYGPTGEIKQCSNTTMEQWKSLSEEKILSTLHTFLGRQKQIPPMFSAKKVDGKKLYELARKGVEIERKPCEIDIYNIELQKWNPITYHLSLIISCSPGTYIRTLAHDIGKKLGVGAYCKELRRTAIGDYSVEDAIDVKEITEENWVDYMIEI